MSLDRSSDFRLPGYKGQGITSATGNPTGTGNTSIISAPAAGLSIYIVSIQLFNQSTSAQSRVDLKDGTTTFKQASLAPVGGGAVITFPIAKKLTAATAFQAALGATGDVLLNVDYYVG